MNHEEERSTTKDTKDTKAKTVRRISLCVLGVLCGGFAVTSHLAVAADAVDSIVNHAVAIQLSLANDKLDGVAQNASGIASDAASLGKAGEKIVAGAMALQKAKKIAEARDAFGKMSDALVAYLDGAKRQPGGGVRVAFCPMAVKPWLQKDGAIQNPYYGSQMLGCGSFRK